MTRTQRKPRHPEKSKKVARNRVVVDRRRFRRRNAVVLLAVAATGLIVFIATRPSEPEGPSSTAFTGADFHSMVVDPGDASRLFVGGHSAVSVSSDAAKTWREVTSLRNADAMGWAFTETEILVGGHPGISVSTDGGNTFRQDNQGLPTTDIHALGGRGGVIYAASPRVGFLASADGRKTWEVRSSQRGQSFMGRILVDPRDANHVFAADMAAGVVESHDGGRTWIHLGGLQSVMWLSWSPSEPVGIVASGPKGAVISTDGGRSWKPFDLPEGAQMVEIASNEPNLMYAGRHGGHLVTVFISRDGGRSWMPSDVRDTDGQ